MSTVNPLQGSQSPWGNGQTNPFQQMMNAASQVLGLSSQQLRSDLQSGQSLAQIAQSQGMSTTDLVNGIVSALESSGGTSSGSTTNLTQMVTNMVNATPGGHHRHWHHGTGSAGDSNPMQAFFQQTMNSAAQALNLSPQTLMTDLGSGQSLAQVAQSQGMSTTDLVNSIVSALQSSGNTPSGSSTADLTQFVTNMVNAVPGQQSGNGNPFSVNLQG